MYNVFLIKKNSNRPQKMNQIVQREQLHNFYSNSLYDKFRSLITPLEQCFGLNAFFYSMITREGNFFQIGNMPELSEYYFSEQFYKENPFFRHPDNFYHNQLFIGADHPDNTYQKIQQKIQAKYGVGNTLVIYKKSPDATHLLMPTSSDLNLPLNTVYLNNLSALNSFAEYFLREWQEEVSKMEPYTFNLADHIGPRFFLPEPAACLTYVKMQKDRFLRQIGVIKDYYPGVNTFSKREKDCIKELLKGKTSIQIGKTLKLSFRTVEHYLDNIKKKLNCNTKFEIFERLQFFIEHDLF